MNSDDKIIQNGDLQKGIERGGEVMMLWGDTGFFCPMTGGCFSAGPMDDPRKANGSTIDLLRRKSLSNLCSLGY